MWIVCIVEVHPHLHTKVVLDFFHCNDIVEDGGEGGSAFLQRTMAVMFGGSAIHRDLVIGDAPAHHFYRALRSEKIPIGSDIGGKGNLMFTAAFLKKG